MKPITGVDYTVETARERVTLASEQQYACTPVLCVGVGVHVLWGFCVVVCLYIYVVCGEGG